ncbi:MAG: 50S ribosomal protein L19 [Parcubacteria group bacterium]|nr:50S ribosomal protein L19 [Parcubacteria group bacterium]
MEETEKPKAKKGKFDYEEISTDDIRPGMLIRVHQKIIDTNPKGEEKERTQIFQGMVIGRNHGKEVGATITVRKASGGIGVEKIFPLKMPSLTKFELVRTYRVRQAKPYYLRTTKKRLREIKA